MDNEKKIGLALGSGSLNGLAHIGVIKVLRREKIPVHCVAGSSMGAVIGAFYCGEVNWEMLEKLVCQMRQYHIVDLAVPKKGLIKGQKIYEIIKLLTKNKTFSQLKIPLAVTATDLQKGELVIIKDGAVAEAVRASISIPGIFKPVERQQRILVDGAVMERVPVSAARGMGADIIIAVDVKSHTENTTVQVNNIFDVILQSIDLLEAKAFRNCCALADISIFPKLKNSDLLNFAAVEEIIKAGEIAAEEKINTIKAKIVF